MSQMKIYRGADISFRNDDEVALAALLTVTDEDGDVIKPPPSFPLTRAQLVFNGDQATISIPNAKRRHERVCRLIDAKLTEPRKEGDPIVIVGTAPELFALGFQDDNAVITATITGYKHCATC